MIHNIPKHFEDFRAIAPNPYVDALTMLIIVGVSFYIYFRTKEFYDLTKHRGINYFRKAFLFFGLASLVNFTVHILRPVFDFGRYFKGGFFIMSTLTLIAVLYAFFSLFWKELEEEKHIYTIAIIIFLLSYFVNIKPLVMLFQSLLFIIIGVVSYSKYKRKLKKKKKPFLNIYLMYIGLFVFWLLNAIRTQLAIFFDITGEVISILSALIFIYILYVFLRRFIKE